MNNPDFCQGRDFSNEKDMISKQGFFCHMVFPESENDLANYHTHGLPQSSDHPDIQVVIALSKDQYGPIIHGVYEKIKDGTKFEVGIQYDEIIRNMPVEFIWAVESGRDVLRMILPDTNGNTSKETIGLSYGQQWVDTFESPQLGVWEVESW